MRRSRRGSTVSGRAGGLSLAGATQLDQDEISRIFRSESGRAVATLVRRFGDIDIAEEAVQEAFVEAVRRWPDSGLPPSPAGWIITTARNRAVDRLRRESKRDDRQRQFHDMTTPDDSTEIPIVEDDQLRLIFTCCHPALNVEAQVALTLKLIGGLQTAEIAKAFMTPETTMAQRLVRAKKKIKGAKIPYRIPGEAELPDRLGPVLSVIYLVFNEGYVASSGDDLIREDLSMEAIRLGRLLARLMPDEPEVAGLLALMLLTESRRLARVDAEGNIVTLGDQDRSRWDRALIDEGQLIVKACIRRNAPGPFQYQAAISAVHSDAPTADATDWHQIVRLYDQLVAVSPTPVTELNRAIALAETGQVDSALDVVERLQLDDYHLWHATRGQLLGRLGRDEEARAAFLAGVELTDNRAEQRHLRQLAGRV